VTSQVLPATSPRRSRLFLPSPLLCLQNAGIERLTLEVFLTKKNPTPQRVNYSSSQSSKYTHKNPAKTATFNATNAQRTTATSRVFPFKFSKRKKEEQEEDGKSAHN